MMINKLFTYILLFSLLFVGDYSIIGIPIYFILYFINLIFRVECNIQYSYREFLLQFILFSIFYINLFFEIFSLNFYSFSIVILILSINILPTFHFFITNQYSFNSKISIILLIFIFVINLYSFTRSSNYFLRNSYIFGPNIFYRVLSYLFSLSILPYYFKLKEINKKFIFALFTIFIINLFFTGSRAVIFIVIAYIFFFINFIKIYNLFSFKFIFYVTISSYLFFILINTYFGRLFYYANNNGSIISRFDFFYRFKFFLNKYSFSNLFGLSSKNIYLDFYPHNIFIENIIYNGLFPFILTIISYFLFFSFQFSKKYKFIYIIFISFFLGSLLSGSMFDNYLCLVVPLFFFKNKIYSFEFNNHNS